MIIRGGGAFASPILAQKSITILGGANQTTLTGVTITNPDPNGYGIQIESSSPTITDSTFTNNGRGGIVVVGKSAPLIRNNFFSKNGADGISIHHTSRPTIQENIFEQTGSAIAIRQSAAPLIIGNRITQNKTGIVVQDSAQPKLRKNSVESNEQDGLVAIAAARPDLGTASDPGGNFFRNNGQYDINAEKTNQVITALGNELVKTVGQLNIRETDVTATQPSPSSKSTAKPVPAAIAIAPPTVAPEPLPRRAQTTKPPSVSVAITPRFSPEPPLPDRTQNVPSAPPKPAAIAAQTSIPFGTQLSPLSPSQEKASGKPILLPLPKQISQATAPAPLTDQKPAARQPDTPKQNITTVPIRPVDRNSAIPFPTPAALSSNPPNLQKTPRPIQIVRMAVPSQRPSPTVAVTPSVATPTPKLIAPKPITPAIADITRPTPREIVPPPRPVLSLVYVSPTPTPKISPSISTPKPSPSAPAIAIPVPPPESGVVPPPIQRTPPALAVAPLIRQGNPRSSSGADLLPVPSSNIPVGNIGDMPSVYVSRSPSSRQTGFDPPSPPSQVGVTLARYRVMVEAGDDSQQEQVRSLIPDAFPVAYNGRTVMQVGAFSDRAKANQLVELLANQGLQVSIESLE
ncbi:MAG: DUF1565 domain-containing protein [Leptolyngbyaceae cyanobacterium RU_5_1]|nr:DUF1565 domain-containing protein [Leptolyngbyaceae cyanobacterium RU_5_1]